jgi:hypothetical protein
MLSDLRSILILKKRITQRKCFSVHSFLTVILSISLFRRFLAQLNQRRVEIETFRLSFVCQMLTTIRQFL